MKSHLPGASAVIPSLSGPLVQNCAGQALRVLFVHDRFGAMAGAEVNAFLTAEELKSRGHAVAILHGAPTGKGEEAWRDVFDYCWPIAGQPIENAIGSAIDTFAPDVVYIHNMPDLEVIEALLETGLPLVRMVHDHDLYCMRSYKYHPINRSVCMRPFSAYCIFPCGAPLMRNRGGGLPFRWVSFWAKKREIKLNQRLHRVVVATDYMKQELLRNGFAGERIEIHAPVPRTADVTLESSFSDRNLVVYAGQIIRGKGVDVLLESLAKMKVQFECIIAGEGGHRKYCEGLARELGLAKRVTFTGYLPSDQLQKCYSEASVAVMSSLWPEPFGAAGLEAMRYGLPVVAFDTGGIKEWLMHGHNGFLVPRLNRAQFAARIEELLVDKRRARQMGARGRQFAREKFNFVQYITGLEAMFHEVICEVRPDKQAARLRREESALVAQAMPEAVPFERPVIAPGVTLKAASPQGDSLAARETELAKGAALTVKSGN